jgi:GNAT superfamily N-acetyltransferase
LAAHGHDVIGYAAIVREPDHAGFRSRGIPLIHQVAVAGPFRRQGVAMLLMDAVWQLARDRGIATLGITVGLSGEYGPMARLSSYTGGAAMHLMAGAHARASGRCARGCWSPWTTT